MTCCNPVYSASSNQNTYLKEILLEPQQLNIIETEKLKEIFICVNVKIEKNIFLL